MNLRGYVIALILFSGIIAVSYVMFGSLATQYNNSDIVDEDFDTQYNKLSENADKIAEIQDGVRGNSTLAQLTGTTDLLFGSTLTVGNIIFSSFSTMGDQFSNIAIDLGVPTTIINLAFIIAFSIILILVVFAILNAWNKVDKL